MLPSETEWCERVHWVRRVIVADGKIVHNPTCPFGFVYTGRELSLLKTLASKVTKMLGVGWMEQLAASPTRVFMIVAAR